MIYQKFSYFCLDFVLNENSYQEKMPRSEPIKSYVETKVTKR